MDLSEWCKLRQTYGGGTTMRTYKITYHSGATETVEAATYVDVGDHQWIDFVDGQGTKLLRVEAKRVERVEAVQG